MKTPLTLLFQNIQTQTDTKAVTYCQNCRKETIIQKGYKQNIGFKYRCTNSDCKNAEIPGKTLRTLYTIYRGAENLYEIK